MLNAERGEREGGRASLGMNEWWCRRETKSRTDRRRDGSGRSKSGSEGVLIGRSQGTGTLRPGGLILAREPTRIQVVSTPLRLPLPQASHWDSPGKSNPFSSLLNLATNRRSHGGAGLVDGACGVLTAPPWRWWGSISPAFYPTTV